jgi:hypothetical protein
MNSICADRPDDGAIIPSLAMTSAQLLVFIESAVIATDFSRKAIL